MQQGAIQGIREYAAQHAGREEELREAKSLVAMVSSYNYDEARRKFSMSTEAKVRSAVGDLLQAQQQPHA